MNYIVKKIEKKVYTNNKNNIFLNIKKDKSITYSIFLKNSDKLYFFNVTDKKYIKQYLKNSGI